MKFFRTVGAAGGSRAAGLMDSLGAEKVPEEKFIGPINNPINSPIVSPTMSHQEPSEGPPGAKTSRLEVLFEDDFLVAITKPSGLSVHRGWDRQGPFALQLTRDQIGRRVFPVHRLDRPTSGVLIFALESEVAARMQEQFQRTEVEKTYLALVRGIPPASGTIDHPVPRSKDRPERVSAVTDFELLGTFERYGWVKVKPRTGRTHQIRRHMKHRSWHLIGDVHYGKGEHNRLFRRRFDVFRLALHALELRFHHPVDGGLVTIRSPLTEDLAEPLRMMGFDEHQLQGGRGPIPCSSAQEP